MRVSRPVTHAAPLVEAGQLLPAVAPQPMLPAVLDPLITERVLSDLQRANIYFKAGFFNVKSVEEAFAKMQFGKELGIGEVAALKELYPVNGKLGMSAALMGALIRKSQRYNYIVSQLTNQVAILDFFDKGEFIGRSEFTMQDAQAAGLHQKDPYKKYPRNMLLARALANGARWFTPDVFLGSVYTPEELDIIDSPNVVLEEPL